MSITAWLREYRRELAMVTALTAAAITLGMTYGETLIIADRITASCTAYDAGSGGRLPVAVLVESATALNDCGRP